MKMETKDLIMQSEVNRRRLMEIIYKAGAGHTGGDLSVMNLMTALYFDIMNVNPEDPKMPDRDRFVLSKGHCVEALYTVLEARGFIKPGVLEGRKDAEGNEINGSNRVCSTLSGSLALCSRVIPPSRCLASK